MSESPDDTSQGLRRLRAACAQMVNAIDEGAGSTTIGFCVQDILSAVDRLSIDWQEDYDAYVVVPREHVAVKRERLLQWFDEHFMRAGVTRLIPSEQLASCTRLTAEDVASMEKE